LPKLNGAKPRSSKSDIEGVLAFAEHVIGNAAALWINASPDDRLALQRAFFPDGLIWDGAGFGTAVTCLAFKPLPFTKVEKSRMASPPGTVHGWHFPINGFSDLKAA
jgi:hypothetical protein